MKLWIQRSSWSKGRIAALVDLLWCGGLAPALALLALATVALAYQVPVAGREPFAANPSPLRLSGVHRPEPAAHGAFQRWTTGRARVRLPGVGAGALIVRKRFFGGPEASAGRTLRVGAPERVLFEAPLRPHWQKVHLVLPPQAVASFSGDLILTLETEPFVAPPDTRALGISLDWIEVRPGAGGWRAPPLALAANLALTLLLGLWVLRLSGLPTRLAVLPALALLVYIGLMLAGWPGGSLEARMQVALGLPVLLKVLPLTLLLALALRLLPLRPLQSAGLPAPTMIRLAVLLIFTLRLAGTLHPLFMPIDHGLRANQLLLIAAGEESRVRERLEQQYEWGTREPVPYSLLTYYMLLPLTAIWNSRPALIEAVKVVTALFEATLPLLLLALLQGGPQRHLGAAWGGLVYAALPVGYLFFHDGSFPTTIGVWLTLIALVAAHWLLALWLQPAPVNDRLSAGPGPGFRGGLLLRGVVAALALTVAIGAYVTHVAFVPFLAGAMGVSLALLDGAAGRRASRSLLLSLVLGATLAWALVYGSYTVTLVQRTIPSYLGLIASEGSVGRDSALFFGTPINSFGQHLAAHFRVWPVLLAGAVLTGLALNWRGRFVTYLGLAYAALFAATSLVERWFGLWNKHMVFVAPAVALLAGVGLAWLWRRGRAGRVVCLGLLAYLFWESVSAWGNRVLWYHIPPGAL
ncbi:MAG: hypothetical protein RMK84_11180 [Oscillochloridaceae bacterium]|nr:hypothetical protein [Chloroflexaceae bacterium]MDW8390677.1 hypothetical protein [Oscillochloridaceae bacterium]